MTVDDLQRFLDLLSTGFSSEDEMDAWIKDTMRKIARNNYYEAQACTFEELLDSAGVKVEV